MVAEYTLLFITNSAITNYSSQFFCLWLTKNYKYYCNSWFICLVWLSVCGWNNVDKFVSISNTLFNSFVNFITNYSPLSNITLFSNPCNFYMLSLNSLINPSAIIPSVIAIKCVILSNLTHTTKIVSFSATNSNFVIKSTIKYVYSLFSTLFIINFSTGTYQEQRK